jgi:carboxyl-terminal processing protease
MTQLIFDLRTNSGGYLEQAVDVADNFFVTKDTIVYTEGRRPRSRKAYKASPRKGNDDYALVVLIDRWSASASEIVAGAIQDLDRGLIVGETSFGKGLVQQQWILNDDSALRVTIGRYYTPSGRLIQRPYGDGTHEYYRELADEHREEKLDSLISDRPRYKTKSGREVYGGGGITPDVFVALENRSPEVIKLLRNEKRITFNWGTEKAPTIRSDWLSANDFIKNFQISEDQLSSFFEYAIQEGVLPIRNEDELENDIPYLKVVLKAEIGGTIWGRSTYYQVLVSGDSQVIESRKLLERAKELLTTNSG